MERALRLAGIIGAIVLVLLIVGFVLAAVFNVLLDVLYIFLIILAAFTLFATALLIYSVLLLIQTIVTVRDEMKPLLASVNQTADYLKDTAKTAEEDA
ncbi:MAG: cobalamin biosynthesis protein [Chloroflexi bacterium]|nr:MAG: cobalamin biosynthesis protein [Chloroflexota bacterium]